MNDFDRKIQEALESGEKSDHPAAKEYEKVFRALSSDPGYKLPVNFADRIVDKISSRGVRDSSSDWWWLGAGVFLLVVVLIVAIGMSLAHFSYKPQLPFLSYLLDYKGIIVAAAVLIIIFNQIEKRLIHHS